MDTLPRRLFLLLFSLLLLRSVRGQRCDAADQITELTLNVTNSSTVTLAWRETLTSQMCLDHYTVSWCIEPTPSFDACAPEIHNLMANETTFTITDLQSCSYYRVTVAAVGVDGLTSNIQDLVVTSPVDEVVQNLQVSLMDENLIAATWDVVGDDACIDRYLVCWSAEGTHQERCNSSEFTSYDLSDADLQPCTNYTVSVACHYLSNSTSRIFTTHFLTGAGNVVSLNASYTRDRRALVTWQPPAETCADTYLLDWCVTGLPGDVCYFTGNVTLDPSLGEYNITDFHPCVYYVVSIRARTPDGMLSATTNAIVITQEYDFGQLRNVTITVGNDKQFDLAYSPPEYVDYCVDRYMGCFKEVNSSGDPTCITTYTEGFWSNNVFTSPTKECTQYEVTLTATSKDNRTTSTALNFTTSPGTVVDLQLRNGSAGPDGSSVIVSWEIAAENTCMKSQYLRYSSFDEDVWVHFVNLSIDAREYVVSGMTPCTNYLLEVVVEPDPVNSNTSQNLIFTSSNVTTVSQLKVDATTNSSFNMSYLAPEVGTRCVSKYSVCWKVSGVTEHSTCESTRTAGMTRLAVHELANCTSYNVSITPVSPNRDRYTPTYITATTTGCSISTTSLSRSSAILGANALWHVGIILCGLLFHGHTFL